VLFRLFVVFALAISDPKREAESLMQRNPGDDRAGELLEKAVASSPNDAEAHYLLGRWALVKRRFERAVEAEKRAAELSSGNLTAQMQAWTIVAVANDQMNRAAEADSAFRKALALNRLLPRFDPNAAYEYLKVLERDHRDKEAHEIIAGILKRSPEYGPAHLSVAKEFAAMGKDREAVKEAEFALTRSQGNRVVERDAHYLLARLYVRLKEPDLAELHKKWLGGNP
jgi:tetratricopeptide (TPR) repeat protein